MHRKIIHFLLTTFLIISANALFAQDDSLYVEILTDPFEVTVGDTAYVEAIYVDSSGVEHDTSFAWSVLPVELGPIDSSGQFVAADTGRGYIYADFNGLTDSVAVEVTAQKDDDDNDDDYPYLVIKPHEKELEVGESYQFTALYVAGEDDERDTTVTWEVEDSSVVSVDSNCLVTALSEGETNLNAYLDSLTASAEVEVEEEDHDDDDDRDFPFLQVVPEEAELDVGDSLAFKAYYVAGEDDKKDTTVAWSLSDSSWASIDSTGLLTALAEGEDFYVIATLDSLTAKAEVEIEEEDDDDDGGHGDDDHHKIVVKPKESIVYVGATIQFTARYKDEDDDSVAWADSNLTWSLEGMPVGTIDQNGLFTADSTGFALVFARLSEDVFGTAFVLVIDSVDNPADLNSITITKNKRRGHGYSNGHGNKDDEYKVIKTLKEGEVWKLGGLPSPMNFLNGGRVYFPVGSLKEDIRIHMEIPDFDKDDDEDSTDFGAPGVVSAVDFQVFVDDWLIEPYYFEEPLLVGLVYKRGLLERLNIDPYTLALYFTYNSTDSVHFDTSGIAYTTIDPHRNRVYSAVAHFSTLSAKGKENSVSGVDNTPEEIPTNFELYQNYPNPFNPSTTIKYYLPQISKVKVVVYDILGKQIATLVNEQQTEGFKSVIWSGMNSGGRQVSSGIYFYQLQTENFIQTRKMMLIK